MVGALPQMQCFGVCMMADIWIGCSYNWVVCVGYRSVFCKELKRQNKYEQHTTQKYKIWIAGFRKYNRLALHLFHKLVLAFQNEHGVGSLAHCWICIFCILYFWNFGFVFFCLYFVFLKFLVRIFLYFVFLRNCIRIYFVFFVIILYFYKKRQNTQ